MHTFLIPTNTGLHCIATNQIVRVEALSNYSKFYLLSGRPIVIGKVLKWCENRLPQDIFVRVHRSHLVNKLFIKNICIGNCKTLLLTNGETVTVSRRKAGATNKQTMLVGLIQSTSGGPAT